ncbi:MAG: primosomal protein N' [Deltaproteobacteria bacterium]|nr:primosomal protein N' [Deltaproteobacteria bacterium]
MNTDVHYIEVAVALPVYQTFTYQVPEHLVSFATNGKRMLVPFGMRTVTGYSLGPGSVVDQKEIKVIYDVLDEAPLFPSNMIPFFRWIADYYMHPIGDVIKSALPGGINYYDRVTFGITGVGEKAIREGSITPLEDEILRRLKREPCSLKVLNNSLGRKIPNSLIHAMDRRRLIKSRRELKGGRTRTKMARYVDCLDPGVSTEGLSKARIKIIEAVKREGEISVRKLKEMVPSAPRLIKSLADTGYISIFNKPVYRDPFGEPIKSDSAPPLTKEQKHGVSKIAGLLEKGFATCLLAGVTGSGKTEVYMQLASEVIRRGHSVLVLVPEIALISQMERRFRARFGECVAVLHSGLSAGERHDQWMRIARKEVAIAIGARSAIFTPFEDIGIIIVDEEHDTSYKQEAGLRYNARDLAVVRAKRHDAVVLLGSATPSVQSYYNVTINKSVEITLLNRVEKRPLPEITVIDLCKSRDVRGIRRFMTPALLGAMKETLDRGEQILLFLNRRGFASFPICKACGEAVTCRNCDISLTLHQNTNAFRCHYCNFTCPSTTRCFSCGSSKIILLGMGTEKVETAVKALFPAAQVVRMDRDTTARKGSIIKILRDLRNGATDILIGTQMVAKGHDFPNITLVGIICADLSLSFPDFRAGERTFQLLAQVSGRAGRGDVPGRAILQTYNPDHFSILAAKDQDFKRFYSEEIAFRKALSYPPFSRMILLKVSGRDKEKTRRHAQSIGDLCHTLKMDQDPVFVSVEMLGPIEASLPKIAKRFRWQILLKGTNVFALRRFIRQLLDVNTGVLNNRHVKVALDVDPYFMM